MADATTVLALASTLTTGLAACGTPPVDHVTQVLATRSASASPSASASAAGLVTGFPDVVPIPPGARITASAMQAGAEKDLLGVSVTGTSTRSTAQLLAFFHDRLRRAGFTATDDSLLPEGASGAAFGRGGRELLLVAVVDRGTERSWSVGGTVAR